MEQNPSLRLSVQRLAEKVGVSTRQLERLFKSVTGHSPQEAYLNLRLKHAKWMLKTEMSLASIAVEAGFVDGSHLSKAFKAAFGTSPSEEWRRTALLPVDEGGPRVYG
jgi:transcriptional regulator GlxA family with amidase domain